MRHFPGVVTLQRWVPELVDGFMDPKCGIGIPALGRFQDPLERLGLAHFHEHMLFLGADPPFFSGLCSACHSRYGEISQGGRVQFGR